MVPGEKFSTTTSAQSISGCDHLRAFGTLHIQRQAALGGVQVREPGLVVEIAGTRSGNLHIEPRQTGSRAALDLHDISAQVAEGLCGDRADERPGEIQTRTPARGPGRDDVGGHSCRCDGCGRRCPGRATDSGSRVTPRPHRVRPGIAAKNRLGLRRPLPFPELRACRCGSPSTSAGDAQTP